MQVWEDMPFDIILYFQVHPLEHGERAHVHVYILLYSNGLMRSKAMAHGCLSPAVFVYLYSEKVKTNHMLQLVMLYVHTHILDV